MDDKTITYFVDGDPQTTTEKKLTVGTILSKAGFTPVEDYVLIRLPDKTEFSDYEKELPIHENQKFTKTFKGTTPVS